MGYPYLTQQGYNPYVQAMMQQYQMPSYGQQAQTTTFYNVPSEDVARRWEVSPNSTARFIDDNKQYVYMKSVGMSILEPPVFERYKLVKDSEEQPPIEVEKASSVDMSQYMTKSEFESYKTVIDDIQKFMKEMNE